MYVGTLIFGAEEMAEVENMLNQSLLSTTISRQVPRFDAPSPCIVLNTTHAHTHTQHAHAHTHTQYRARTQKHTCKHATFTAFCNIIRRHTTVWQCVRPLHAPTAMFCACWGCSPTPMSTSLPGRRKEDRCGDASNAVKVLACGTCVYA